MSPFRTAAYSDAGYTLLGEVLARLSGSNYLDALHNFVLDPLGLNETSTTAPTGPGANVIDRSTQESSSWRLDIPLYAGWVSLIKMTNLQLKLTLLQFWRRIHEPSRSPHYRALDPQFRDPASNNHARVDEASQRNWLTCGACGCAVGDHPPNDSRQPGLEPHPCVRSLSESRR